MRFHVRSIVTMATLAGGALAAAPAAAQTLFALGEVAALDFTGVSPGAAYVAPGADEVFIHVSIDERKLRIMRGSRVLDTFGVAVGKGAYLRHRNAQNGGWLFETPVGVFSVGRKERDPVWYAPDWHFIEKGLPVPAADDPRRYFPGEMGEYAVYLGDGLAIHGTKYVQSVGQAASHGCLRMDDRGISEVYRLVSVGSRVIITP